MFKEMTCVHSCYLCYENHLSGTFPCEFLIWFLSNMYFIIMICSSHCIMQKVIMKGMIKFFPLVLLDFIKESLKL